MPDASVQRAAGDFVTEMVQLINSVLERSGQRWISLGTIQPDYSLYIHEDTTVFPPGQYAGPDVYQQQQTSDSTVPGVSTGDGSHHHTLPDSLRPLAPGDRVLVAWLEGENDPVIVHRIVPFFSPAQIAAM